MSTTPVSLVTGAAGFLGSHLVESLLAKGHAVRALDMPQARFEANLGGALNHPALSVDRRDLLSIDAQDPVFASVTHLYHCAGLADHVPSMKIPEVYMQANVMAVVRVLEAARHHGIAKVVYPSSAAVYGTATPPTPEDHPINPGNPYALTKWMGEEVCAHWSKVFGVATVSFRIFNCYGPRAMAGGPIGFFMKLRAEGKPLTVTGDGGAVRDFIHVSDAVAAMILGAEKGKAGEAYNLATGKGETVLTLATLIGGAENIAFVDPRPEPPVILADMSKARRDLGFEPKVTLADGIADLLARAG